MNLSAKLGSQVLDQYSQFDIDGAAMLVMTWLLLSKTTLLNLQLLMLN